MHYLDHNAATPVLPEVQERVARLLRDVYGNASSVHAAGRAAKRVLEEAREILAEGLGCSVHEVLFTSGGTESNNLALRGFLAHPKAPARGLAVSAFEHPSVLETAKDLQATGGAAQLELLRPDAEGRVTAAALGAVFDREAQPSVGLVSVLMAHNELGTVQPIAELATKAHAQGAYFHTDAVQAFGRLGAFSVTDLGADLLSASGHKLGGLKGAGLLYVKAGTPLAERTTGGPQERQLRAGTENGVAIAAMAQAFSVWRNQGETWRKTMALASKTLCDSLRALLPDLVVNSASSRALVNTLHVTLPGCPSDLLVAALDMQGLCVSAGAACASGSLKASQAMLAMGRSEGEARCVLRFSLGPDADPSQMPEVAATVARVAGLLRKTVG